jgi:hypothetical protein
MEVATSAISWSINFPGIGRHRTGVGRARGGHAVQDDAKRAGSHAMGAILVTVSHAGNLTTEVVVNYGPAKNKTEF